MNAENKQASNIHTPCSHLLTDLVNCGVENNTRVITLSHEYHTKEAVVASVFSFLEYPVTPSPSHDCPLYQISQLHYINLLCLDLPTVVR